VNPKQGLKDAHRGTCPDDGQQTIAKGRWQPDEGDGRVGAGDEHEDRRVIGPAHPCAGGRAPIDAVVGRRYAEEQDEAGGETKGGQAGPRRRCHSGEHGAGADGNEDGALMKPAAKQRLDGCFGNAF